MSPTRDLVLVDGATGYLGTHLVQALCKHDYKVRCLVRKDTSAQNLEFIKSTGVEIVPVDYARNNAESYFTGARYAVHLVGSIAPPKGESFSRIHKDMTKQWVDNCVSASVEKAVLVTALGTSENSPSQYHKTKREAEKALEQSRLSHVILRPSLLIGHQVGIRHSKLVKRLIELIAKKPRVPLIHGGQNKIQPLFIGDMSDCIVNSLDKKFDKPVNLAGPQILTLAQLVEKLSSLLDKKPKIAAINPQLGLAIASFLSIVQDVPILSKDQVILAQMDNITSDAENGTNELLGRPATGLDEAIKTYKNTELLKQVKSQ